MHSILRTPNARFWVFVNDAWVKLTLQPDQSLSWSHSSPDEEGYSFEASTWRHEGDSVVDEWTNGGSDCDGPIRRSGNLVCHLSELRNRVRFEPKLADWREYHDGEYILAPQWVQEGDVEVFDAYARAAGY